MAISAHVLRQELPRLLVPSVAPEIMSEAVPVSVRERPCSLGVYYLAKSGLLLALSELDNSICLMYSVPQNLVASCQVVGGIRLAEWVATKRRRQANDIPGEVLTQKPPKGGKVCAINCNQPTEGHPYPPSPSSSLALLLLIFTPRTCTN